MALEVARSVDAVRQASRDAKKTGMRVALVATMGGLHKGHLSLVRKAEQIADLVIVSLFINPIQFNNPKDLETYPCNDKEDLNTLENTKAEVVFMPSAEEMFPDGFSTSVNVKAAENILCDAHRPGHFSGVATVVAKLFLQTEPDFACFGEKDYQQLFIIRRLARDLNIPVKIVPVSTVREKDGLALSSRNVRLNPSERLLAPELNKRMRVAAKAILGGTEPGKACETAISDLQKSGDFRVEYLEHRSGETLELINKQHVDGRLFAAAWLGDVRLIDNISVRLNDG